MGEGERRGGRLVCAYVVVLVAATALKGVVWSVAIPPLAGPDEDAHYAYVQMIGETGRWPAPGEPSPSAQLRGLLDAIGFQDLNGHPERRFPAGDGRYGPGEHEVRSLPREAARDFSSGGRWTASFNPPGYYVVASLAYRALQPADALDTLYHLRIFHVATLAALALLLFFGLRRLLPDHPHLAFAAPIAVTYLPMMSQQTSIVSPDGLVNLTYTGFILLSALAAVAPERVSNGLFAASLGAMAAASVWLKQSGIVAYAVIPAQFALMAWAGAIRRREALRGAGIALGVALVLAAPYWIRNWVLFDDPLLQRVYLNTAVGLPPDASGIAIPLGPFFALWLDRTWAFAWQSTFVGILGWLDTPIRPKLVYTLAKLATLAAALSLIAAAARAFMRGRGDLRALVRQHLLALMLVLHWVACFAIIALAMYMWSFAASGRPTLGGINGRYLYVAIVPFVVLLARGLAPLVPAPLRVPGGWALAAAIAALNYWALLGCLIPRFHAPGHGPFGRIAEYRPAWVKEIGFEAPLAASVAATVALVVIAILAARRAAGDPPGCRA